MRARPRSPTAPESDGAANATRERAAGEDRAPARRGSNPPQLTPKTVAGAVASPMTLGARAGQKDTAGDGGAGERAVIKPPQKPPLARPPTTAQRRPSDEAEAAHSLAASDAARGHDDSDEEYEYGSSYTSDYESSYGRSHTPFFLQLPLCELPRRPSELTAAGGTFHAAPLMAEDPSFTSPTLRSWGTSAQRTASDLTVWTGVHVVQGSGGGCYSPHSLAPPPLATTAVRQINSPSHLRVDGGAGPPGERALASLLSSPRGLSPMPSGRVAVHADDANEDAATRPSTVAAPIAVAAATAATTPVGDEQTEVTGGRAAGDSEADVEAESAQPNSAALTRENVDRLAAGFVSASDKRSAAHAARRGSDAPQGKHSKLDTAPRSAARAGTAGPAGREEPRTTVANPQPVMLPAPAFTPALKLRVEPPSRQRTEQPPPAETPHRTTTAASAPSATVAQTEEHATAAKPLSSSPPRVTPRAPTNQFIYAAQRKSLRAQSSAPPPAVECASTAPASSAAGTDLPSWSRPRQEPPTPPSDSPHLPAAVPGAGGAPVLVAAVEHHANKSAAAVRLSDTRATAAAEIGDDSGGSISRSNSHENSNCSSSRDPHADGGVEVARRSVGQAWSAASTDGRLGSASTHTLPPSRAAAAHSSPSLTSNGCTRTPMNHSSDDDSATVGHPCVPVTEYRPAAVAAATRTPHSRGAVAPPAEGVNEDDPELTPRCAGMTTCSDAVQPAGRARSAAAAAAGVAGDATNTSRRHHRRLSAANGTGRGLRVTPVDMPENYSIHEVVPNVIGTTRTAATLQSGERQPVKQSKLSSAPQASSPLAAVTQPRDSRQENDTPAVSSPTGQQLPSTADQARARGSSEPARGTFGATASAAPAVSGTSTRRRRASPATVRYQQRVELASLASSQVLYPAPGEDAAHHRPRRQDLRRRRGTEKLLVTDVGALDPRLFAGATTMPAAPTSAASASTAAAAVLRARSTAGGAKPRGLNVGPGAAWRADHTPPSGSSPDTAPALGAPPSAHASPSPPLACGSVTSGTPTTGCSSVNTPTPENLPPPPPPPPAPPSLTGAPSTRRSSTHSQTAPAPHAHAGEAASANGSETPHRPNKLLERISFFNNIAGGDPLEENGIPRSASRDSNGSSSRRDSQGEKRLSQHASHIAELADAALPPVVGGPALLPRRATPASSAYSSYGSPGISTDTTVARRDSALKTTDAADYAEQTRELLAKRHSIPACSPSSSASPFLSPTPSRVPMDRADGRTGGERRRNTALVGRFDEAAESSSPKTSSMRTLSSARAVFSADTAAGGGGGMSPAETERAPPKLPAIQPHR